MPQFKCSKKNLGEIIYHLDSIVEALHSIEPLEDYRPEVMTIQEIQQQLKTSQTVKAADDASKFYDVLKKIDEILESDIPEQKFILALLQIKKYVKSTGCFGEFS